MRILKMLAGAAVLTLSLVSAAQTQSAVKERSLTINGHTGRVMIYEIDGRSFVDISALAQIANGTVSYAGNEIVLTVAFADSGQPAQHGESETSDPIDKNALSGNFMSAAVQDLALIKEWGTTLAYAVTKGVPGDGSRLVLFRDRATEGLRLAKVAVSNEADREAMQLLTNHFNNVKGWHTQLINARKTMSTANYSLSEDALSRDALFQKIAACSEFLGTMLSNGEFSDNSSCH
jgi:hypothetical protein